MDLFVYEFGHWGMELTYKLHYITSMTRPTNSKIRIMMWSIVVISIFAAFIYSFVG